jgi:hypothetical protein
MLIAESPDWIIWLRLCCSVGQVVNLRAEWYSAQPAKPAIAARLISPVIRKLRHKFRSAESRRCRQECHGRSAGATANFEGQLIFPTGPKSRGAIKSSETHLGTSQPL